MTSIGSLAIRVYCKNIFTGLLTLSSIGIVNQNIKTMSSFQAKKDFFLSMSLDDKRKQYACGENYITLDMIPSLNSQNNQKRQTNSDSEQFTSRPDLNKQISVYSGDITRLEIDAIVNAANAKLTGGAGVDGFIHRAAGEKDLQEECKTLGGCLTGSCKITGAYRLPAKYILHCVGPIGEKPDLLSSCYKSALNLAVENNIKTIAFPCISTGVYGYPPKNAAKVVLKTIRLWLEDNPNKIDRIIFCLFLSQDLEIYKELLPIFFPE